MKQQILVIHGADSFISYENYLKSLEARTMDDLKDLNRKSWKSFLQDELGEEYEVYNPQMPNKDNAKYAEWKIYFEKMLPLLHSDPIFVGHSMGAIFLAKYFSENTYDKGIKGLFLVAPPYEDTEMESLDDFNLKGNISDLKDKVKNIYIYHSKDDYVVPYAHGEKYKELLPEAIFRSFEDRQHFNQETFPEIISDIQAL